MSSDERVYRAKCRACHRLRDPASQTAKEWVNVLNEHVDKIDLTPEQRAAILRHLQQQ